MTKYVKCLAIPYIYFIYVPIVLLCWGVAAYCIMFFSQYYHVGVPLNFTYLFLPWFLFSWLCSALSINMFQFSVFVSCHIQVQLDCTYLRKQALHLYFSVISVTYFLLKLCVWQKFKLNSCFILIEKRLVWWFIAVSWSKWWTFMLIFCF